jgi:predicted aconitase with swiveling domain
MLEPDEIVALGAIIADELYGTRLPVVVVEREVFDSLGTGDLITIGNGTIERVESGA